LETCVGEVSKTLIDGRMDWRKVAEMMMNKNSKRSNMQCKARWLIKSAKYITKQSSWTPEEDVLLERAVGRVKEVNDNHLNWRLVAKYMGIKSMKECRTRWRKLHPTASSAWSPEEVVFS
jgi:hypothetical protein